MYKDREKQKEASKERMRRYRDRQGVTKGVTTQGVTSEGVTELKWPPRWMTPAQCGRWYREHRLDLIEDLPVDVQFAINEVCDISP